MHYDVEIPEMTSCDVLVCGAGPSGIAAAVSAARQGLDTVLLERYGSVGGCLTMANVTTLMGSATPGGIWQEVMRLLEAPDGGTAVDPESAKGRLLDLVMEAGVRLYLQTPIVDAICRDGAAEGVVALTQEGPAAVRARRVIDATGDGYVVARAGGEVMIGREEDGLVQPVSLMYHIEGVDPACTLVCRHEEDDTLLPGGESYLSLCARAARNGELPPHVTIVRLYPCLKRGEYLVNATQLGGVRTLENGDLTRAESALRSQMEQVNAFLRAHVPGFKQARTRISASTLGVRESRRMRGRYVLEAEDVLTGSRFPDAVVHRANFPIDIHNPTGGGQAEREGIPYQAQDYDIPLRCLQPLGVGHLVLCGRDISGTHRAHASYRVMCIAMAVGQAAAMTAKASLDAGVDVAQVDPAAVQRLLTECGCDLWG